MQYPPGLYASATGLPPMRIVAYTAGKCRWRPDSWDEGTILSEPERVEVYLELGAYKRCDGGKAKPAPGPDGDGVAVPLQPRRSRNIGPRPPK